MVRTWIAIALAALLGACTQPGQPSLPSFAASKIQRARFIYFAGIQLGPGGPGGFLGPGELGVYPATASGDAAPARVIAGKNTGLFEAGGCCVPQAAFFDTPDSSMWTCRTFSKFIDRFSVSHGRGSWGNVQPRSRLAISAGTVSCGGVAISSHGDIVADDINKAFVSTWRAGSTGTDVPMRTIRGPATKLFLPSQITFDGNGDYIVSDRCSPPKCTSDYGGAILTFGATADGNVSPLRSLTGPKTRLSGPNRIAFDPIHNAIYAANLYTNTITAYPAGASGNVAPVIFIHGKKTHLWNPDAIAIDKAGYLYVGNEPVVPGPPPASILIFAPGANGDAAPIQIIQGSKTRLAEVNGISVH